MYGFFQMYLEFNNALTDSVLMALDFNGAKGRNVLHVVDDVLVVVVIGGLDVVGKVVSNKVVIGWVVLNVIPSVVLKVLVVESSVWSVSSVSVLVVTSWLLSGLRVVEVIISALSVINKESKERWQKNDIREAVKVEIRPGELDHFKNKLKISQLRCFGANHCGIW